MLRGMGRKSSLEKQLDLLLETREGEHIPLRDRSWFWTQFKSLKNQGLPYTVAWDYVTLSLMKHYGFLDL